VRATIYIYGVDAGSDQVGVLICQYLRGSMKKGRCYTRGRREREKDVWLDEGKRGI
jgi:hypothetical protein